MASHKYLLARIALLFALVSIPALIQYSDPASRALAAASWSAPANISQGHDYDTAPAVAASPNGSVTITWERRVLTNPTANYILDVGAPSASGPFAQAQLSATHPQKSSGSVRARSDSLGRKHLVWWQYEGSSVCDYYARIEADGHTAVVEKVPGSCGQGMKNTALAVGPDNNAYILFGKNDQTLAFWVRTGTGWTVQGERLPGVKEPEHLMIGVTRGGVIMVAWRDDAPKGFADIYLAARRGPGNWAVTDVSAGVGPGCPNDSRSYYPALAPDPSGGMRLAWTDEHCTPRHDPPEYPYEDVYYREWTPQSGWSSPPVLISGGQHRAAQTSVVVDSTGRAHVVWMDEVDYKLYYSSGRGSSFSAPSSILGSWAPADKVVKDIDLGYSPGMLHLVFSSDRDDPLKEIYYTHLPINEPPPAPPPTPTPQPGPAPLQIPGTGSYTFPETGKAMTGIFLNYWNVHGGLPQQGFPVSGLVQETSPLNGKGYTMQYTERAVFEYHPENQPPFNVLLSQLGTLRYKKKYPNGAPGQVPNNSPGSVLVPETGKRLGGKFLQYRQSHGGLMQQGYPISDEFTEVSDTNGKPYLVQYFERAVFEYHPENQPPYDVLLSLLGNFQYREKYGR